MKKKIITASAAVLLAVCTALITYFAASASFRRKTDVRFAQTVKACRTDAEGVIAGKREEYLSYLSADINSLMTLCMLDGKDKYDDGLRDSLYICFAVIRSRPEGCAANIRKLYDAASAFLENGNTAQFRAGVDGFCSAANEYNVTE